MNSKRVWIEITTDWKIEQIKYNSDWCNFVIDISKEEFEKVMNTSIPYQKTFIELENKYINN